MAHSDWKRYFAVVYDRPPSYMPSIWQTRVNALAMLRSERACCRGLNVAQPVGIVRLRGRKDNPQLQRWLLEHSK